MPDLKKMLTLEALSEALPSWLKRSTKPEYNADEIDSTLTTNQFVTASDKDNWNAKGTYSKPSGGIPKSDLSSIVQTSLEKADSALQSETDPTVPSWAKQSSKPSYTQDEVSDGSTYKRVTQTEKDAWSGKQNALTTTQMQAVNSGITSEMVTQISTNQENGLYGITTGVKNLLPLSKDGIKKTMSGATWNGDTCIIGGLNFTINDDLSIRVKGTPNAIVEFTMISRVSSNVKIFENLVAGDYKLSCDCTPPSGVFIGLNYTNDQGQSSYYGLDTGDGASFTVTETLKNRNNGFWIGVGQSAIGTAMDFIVYPMVCLESVFNSDPSYRPPAMPNYDLTRLESEDRAALAEVVDSGAKNLVNLDACTITSAYPAITIVARNGNEVTVSCDGTQTTPISIDITGINVPTNQFLILSGCASGGGDDSFQLDAFNNGAFLADSVDIGNGSNPFKFTTMTNSKIRIRVAANVSFTNKVFKIMICTKDTFGVSKAFVPYRPGYDAIATRSGVIAKLQAIGTDWTLIDLTFTGTAAYVYTLSAVINASGNFPTGIAISTSNNASDFLSDRNLICKNDESPRTTRMMSCSALDIPYASTVYYVWAKSLTNSTNYVALTYQRERR